MTHVFSQVEDRSLAQPRAQTWPTVQRRHRGLPIVVGVIALCFLALGDLALAGYWARSGVDEAQEVTSQLSVQALISQPDRLANVAAELTSSQHDLQRANLALVPWSPLLDHLGGVPRIGPTLASVPALVRSAGCLAGTGAATANAVLPVQRLQRQPDPAAVLSAAVTALTGAQPDIAQAQQQLQCAIAARKAIDPRLNQDPGRLAAPLHELDGALAQANTVVSTLALVPPAARSLLGFDRPRHYLMLGQDPFELRATGGFIGGMGLITLAQGKVTALDYRGVLQFEPPNQQRLEPPAPLVKYMGLGGWYLRDANWSPDFPTAARQTEAFFQMDQGVTADGVIAIDLYAVQDLLTAIGPVDVPEYHETVTADTVIGQLWEHINASGSLAPAREQDKTDYLSALVAAVMTKLEQPDAASLPRLASAVATAIQERHLLVYVPDPSVQRLIGQVDAGGQVYAGPGDGLAVVDTQVSYGKMTAMVDESLTLDVTIGANGQVSGDTVTVTYANRYNERGALRVWRELHSELFDFRQDKIVSGTGVFATYVRVLAPPGSSTVTVTGGDDAPGYTSTLDRAEFSSYLVVQPGEQRTLRFEYVPRIEGVAPGTYRVTVQKQPGTVANPLTVRVHLNPALGPVEEHPDWTQEDASTWRYAGDLRQDRQLTLKWRMP